MQDNYYNHDAEWNPHEEPPKPENRYRIPVPQQLLVLGVILFVIFAGASMAALSALVSTGEEAVATVSSNVIEAVGGDETTAPERFEDLELTATAATVVDTVTGKVLFTQSEDRVLPLASVTKLMTALVAHEILAPDATVTVSEAALRQYGVSGLLENEIFDRQSLSDMVLMSSSNDGAYALAAAAGTVLDPNRGISAFIDAMNIRARELGMEDTVFRNVTGLDISETESGADGTAADVATLLTYIIENYPDLLTFTTHDRAEILSEDGFSHTSANTNRYIDDIPGLIGSKTGYTTLAGGNLAIAFNAGLNRPVIVVVLGSGRYERFSDTRALAEVARSIIAANQ